MKFVTRLIFIVLAIFIAGVFLLIPSTITVTIVETIPAPSARLSELISNQSLWSKWWHNENAPKQTGAFILNERNYQAGRQTENISEISATRENETVKGEILVASLTPDSSAIQWTMRTVSSSNPITRVKRYFAATDLENDMKTILNSLSQFASNSKNLYGMDVYRERVKDTVLVVTRKTFDHYPNTTEVYAMVDELMQYILQEKATATNAPMLHVLRTDNTRFETMVGIPTNRVLSGKGEIELKRMVPGYILQAEVTGGPVTVNKSLEQLENYRSDHRLVAPAIPFVLLLTDRRKETDTSKWVTRLYYPIF